MKDSEDATISKKVKHIKIYALCSSHFMLFHKTIFFLCNAILAAVVRCQDDRVSPWLIPGIFIRHISISVRSLALWGNDDFLNAKIAF